jgi:hypothetical protein
MVEQSMPTGKVVGLEQLSVPCEKAENDHNNNASARKNGCFIGWISGFVNSLT